MTKVKKVSKIKFTNVSLVPEGACSGAHIKLFKSKEDYKMTFEELMKSLTGEQSELIKAEIEKAKKEAEENAKKKEGEKEPDKKKDEGISEEVMKSLPPSVKEALEKSRKMAEEAERKAEETKLILAKMKEDKEKQEIAEKVEKFKTCGVKTETLTSIFTKAKNDADLTSEIEGILNLMSNIGKDSEIFKSKGQDEGHSVSASDEIRGKAEELQKSKGCSYESAYMEILQNNPELYSKLVEEEYK